MNAQIQFQAENGAASTPVTLLPENIETIRLKLRSPAMADAPYVFDHWSRDREVTRYLSWQAHQDLADTEAFIQRALEKRQTKKAAMWFITKIDCDQPIGYFLTRNYECRVEIACALQRSFWGKGYIFEAGKALVDVIFDRLPNIVRIDALVSVDNITPARMLEVCGAKREGTMRKAYPLPNVSNRPSDFDIFALLRDDWHSIQTNPNKLLQRYSRQRKSG